MYSKPKPSGDLSGVVAPPSLPDSPDAATSKAPCFTDGNGVGQVFHFVKWGLSYGTDDKGHAAALILSILCLCVICALSIIFSVVTAPAFMSDTLKGLTTTFTFIAGIAIGKSVSR